MVHPTRFELVTSAFGEKLSARVSAAVPAVFLCEVTMFIVSFNPLRGHNADINPVPPVLL